MTPPAAAKIEGRVQLYSTAVERERGISVSSAVRISPRGARLQPARYAGPPGFQPKWDFSEDTYRTLTPVNSEVMLLDAAANGAKGGIEEQTRLRSRYCTFSALGKWVTVPLALIPSNRCRSEPLIKTSHVTTAAVALTFVASTHRLGFPAAGRTELTLQHPVSVLGS